MKKVNIIKSSYNIEKIDKKYDVRVRSDVWLQLLLIKRSLIFDFESLHRYIKEFY